LIGSYPWQRLVTVPEAHASWLETGIEACDILIPLFLRSIFTDPGFPAPALNCTLNALMVIQVVLEYGYSAASTRCRRRLMGVLATIHSVTFDKWVAQEDIQRH
jgi:hypothetical protein